MSDITDEMKQIKEEIEEKIILIRNLESQIYKANNEIDKKWKIYFSLCNGHEWENERENYMYGERYQVCKKCGMCR